MTTLLENPSQDCAEMSVAAHNFEPRDEANTMTTVPTNYVQRARRVRPHGLDRALMRLSLATLLWARRHADRTAISYEENMRMHTESLAREGRERDALRLLMRQF